MSGHRNTESGYVLVVLAAMLVILLGFAALAVDLGIMYGARTSAQRAADAAALAGAYTFIESPFSTQPESLAIARAQYIATKNTILGAPIPNSEVAVTVNYPNRLVTVNLTHVIPTFFGRVLGWTSARVSVIAHAEGSKPDKCPRPWFIPNLILASDDPPCDACAPPVGISNPPHVILEGGFPSTTVTDFAKSYMGLQPGPMGAGMAPAPFRIKPGNPSNALGPGEFFAIQLSNDPNQSGGDAYRDNIMYCGPQVNCWDTYSVKTGNMIGPTKQGTEFLLSPTPDTWSRVENGTPIYLSPSGVELYDSHQVVLAPIWDTCAAICPTGGKLTGTNVTVQVIGFARIFVKEIQGNDVLAFLAGAYGCGPAPSGGPNIPLRLVRID